MEIILTLAGLILLHYLISYFFLRFPLILRKKISIKNNLFAKAHRESGFLSVIHRGGSCHNLENTIPAFKFSESTGCDVIEMDVHLTKDKHIIVFHDHDLKRIFGKGIETSEAVLSDFCNPVDNIPVHFNAGKRFSTKGIKYPSRVAPLLDEVLKEFPEMNFSIEIKSHSNEAIIEFAKVIKRNKAEKRILSGSTSHVYMEFARTLIPEMTTFSSKEESSKLIICYFLGFLPYIFLEADCLAMPFFTKSWEEWELKEPHEPTSAIEWYAMKLFTIFFAGFTHHMSKRGHISLPWVVNDEENYETVLRAGGHGVMTDHPVAIADFIEKHNLRK